MPSEDYSSATRGALKIKGVQGSKVDKHKKKKKKPKPENANPEASASKVEEDRATQNDVTASEENTLNDVLAEEDGKLVNSDDQQGGTKTEAEKRFEERRRKNLDDRLKREGVKSHKERVESLNRYLSTLSEHHDMPRIGPG